MRHSLLERQGEKTASSVGTGSLLFLCTSKIGQQLDRVIRRHRASRANPGLGADGKLTQEERERRHLKGLCYYCGLTIDLPAPDCRNSRHPKPPVAGRTTFTITGEPEATIEEVEGLRLNRKTNTRSTPQVCNLDRVLLSTPLRL